MFDNVDSSVIKSAKDLKAHNITLDEFLAITNEAIPSTAKFTTALKNIGANLAVSAVISLVMSAVSGLATAGDEIAHLLIQPKNIILELRTKKLFCFPVICY